MKVGVTDIWVAQYKSIKGDTMDKVETLIANNMEGAAILANLTIPGKSERYELVSITLTGSAYYVERREP